MIVTSSASVIPPPSAYGLPDKFSEWRPNQMEASLRGIQSSARFSVLVAPTGFGKYITAETIARFWGRNAYLTINKGLQNQIVREVPDRFDIRGKANYECRVLAGAGVAGWQARVDQADVLCEGCQFREHGCQYYDDGRRAKKEPRLITNYAKWLTADEESLGQFAVLVCDEIHGGPEQISSSLRIELLRRHVDEFCNPASGSSKGTVSDALPARSIADWRVWAARQIVKLQPRLDARVAEVKAGQRSRIRELRDLRGLVRTLEAMAGRLAETWIEDRQSRDDRIAFEPLWPRAYGELLFRGIPKIVLVSATVRRKTLELMGIDAASSDVDFAEYPSSFPVARRPVIPVRTVQMRASMSDSEQLEAVRRVDQIIDARLDRKGIVHTVSFARAKHLLQNSRHARLMMLNEQKGAFGSGSGATTADVVERFKASPAPRVLVTPSVKEGYDFPMSECEYQVIYKIPLLNRHGSVITDMRCKDDADYDGYQAMMSIVQMCGRGVRSDSDSCENLITDDTWGNWFFRANRRFAPDWFLAAVRPDGGLPKPLPKLEIT